MASASSSAALPGPRRRVLVVDDSPFIRRVVRDVIQQSPDFEVAGEACDGWDALRQVHALAPDLITLDVHMPALDGLATLGHVMREAPRPVVMLSALADGGDTTMRALELGAVDFVRKPAVGDALDLSTLEERLLGALRAAVGARIQSVPLLARARVASRIAAAPAYVASGDARSGTLPVTAGEGAPRADARATGTTPTHVIVIAASTGGPRALAEVVPALAPVLGARTGGARAAVVIAQHMPAGFTDSLARRLAALSSFPVEEARDGDRLAAGRAYVAPGGVHTTIARDGETLRLSVRAGAPVHGVAPAADLLFATAADLFGAACVAVVLTGMGHDGASGARAIRAAGGRLVVQDAATSIVHGMPLAAQQAAGADVAAPLPDIAPAVGAMLRQVAGAMLPGAGARR